MLVTKLSDGRSRAYTRADAIKDGVLFDVTRHATATGFKYPVAVTRAVLTDCAGKAGELVDILMMARNAALHALPALDFRIRAREQKVGLKPYVDLRLALVIEDNKLALTIMHK